MGWKSNFAGQASGAVIIKKLRRWDYERLSKTSGKSDHTGTTFVIWGGMPAEAADWTADVQDDAIIIYDTKAYNDAVVINVKDKKNPDGVGAPFSGIIAAQAKSNVIFNDTVGITIADTDEVNEYYGLDIEKGKATFEKDLSITIDSQGTQDVSAYNHSGGQVIHTGIITADGAVTTLKGATVINIKNNIYDSYACGVEIWGKNSTFAGKDLAVNINKEQTVFVTGLFGTNRSNGIVLGGGSNVAGTLSGDLHMDIANTDWCNGIRAMADSQFTVKGKAHIEVYSDQDLAVGVHSDGAGAITLEKGLEVVSNGDAIRVNEFDGYSGGSVSVNTAGGNDVKLIGDLYSGSAGTINAMFDTADSYLTGSSYTAAGSVMDLTFKNGARWNMDTDSVVSDLTVGQGGVIDMTADGNSYSDLSVEHLAADGGTFVMNVGVEDAAHKYSDKIVLTDSAAGSNTINLINNGGLEEAAANKALLVEGANQNTIFTAGEFAYTGGLYDYDVRLGVEQNGSDTSKSNWYLSSVSKYLTDNVQAMTSGNRAAYSAWIDGNGTLRQRLGELQSGVDNGVWVRMFGGKLGGDAFTNKYKTYQLGYDAKAGDWLVGAAYEYSDGDMDYTGSGTGDNKIGAVSLYGTLHNAKENSNLDIMLKRGRIYGHTDVYGKYSDSSDYSTDATSIGVEYTKRIDGGNNVYFEPQLQLTYGRIDGYDQESARGIRASYDDINSLIGRLGVVAGKEFKRGSAYVKASVLHEFSGSGAVTMLAANGDIYSADKDYGDTWLELGLGGSVALGKNFQLYGDVERSFGGDVTKHWGANLGVQYSF